MGELQADECLGYFDPLLYTKNVKKILSRNKSPHTSCFFSLLGVPQQKKLTELLQATGLIIGKLRWIYCTWQVETARKKAMLSTALKMHLLSLFKRPNHGIFKGKVQRLFLSATLKRLHKNIHKESFQSQTYPMPFFNSSATVFTRNEHKW